MVEPSPNSCDVISSFVFVALYFRIDYIVYICVCFFSGSRTLSLYLVLASSVFVSLLSDRFSCDTEHIYTPSVAFSSAKIKIVWFSLGQLIGFYVDCVVYAFECMLLFFLFFVCMALWCGLLALFNSVRKETLLPKFG